MDTQRASRKEDAQEVLVSEHSRGRAPVIPGGHISVRLTREERLQVLDGLLVADDPYTVPVPVLIEHLEIRP